MHPLQADRGAPETRPKLFVLLSITGAVRDDDGFFDIALDGPVDQLQRFAKLCH